MECVKAHKNCNRGRNREQVSNQYPAGALKTQGSENINKGNHNLTGCGFQADANGTQRTEEKIYAWVEK